MTAPPLERVGDTVRVQPNRLPRPDWTLLAPGALTLGVTLYGITAASYWRDEAATLDATHRPFTALLAMLANVDAVHGAYYLLTWPLVHVLGTSEIVLRLPSASAPGHRPPTVGGRSRPILADPRTGQLGVPSGNRRTSRQHPTTALHGGDLVAGLVHLRHCAKLLSVLVSLRGGSVRSC